MEALGSPTLSHRDLVGGRAQKKKGIGKQGWAAETTIFGFSERMLNLQVRRGSEKGDIIILHSAATPTWHVGCHTGSLATYYSISVVVVSWRVPHDRDTYHRTQSSSGGAVAQYHAIVRLSQPVWISSSELMKRS